jgi:pyruvate formate lyase activating enzyme
MCIKLRASGCQTIREAVLYEKISGDKVRCGLCERRCVIPNGQMGFCRTRLNIDGKLFTRTYGNLSALESRPIEIKPFFHYWPGSTALTFSTWSCNLECRWCQNHHLSRRAPDTTSGSFISQEKIIEEAIRRGDRGLCASFQEPTLLTDWVLGLFEAGSRRGLYCCFVSNGYMTLQALRMLRSSGMDGIKIDLKGNAEVYRRYCGGVDVEKVWRNIREARGMGLHVEVVNLVVTGVNDDDSCLEWLIERHLKEAGAETPLHFTRYSPAYKFSNPPTKIETLERAYEMARKAGVQYPYIGNVPGHAYENTYCPECGETLIRRFGYTIVEYRVTPEKRCPKCRCQIPIVGKYVQRSSGLSPFSV